MRCRNVTTGETTHLDPSKAAGLIARGVVVHAPLSDAEIEAIAREPRLGDEALPASEIAERTASLILIMRGIN